MVETTPPGSLPLATLPPRGREQTLPNLTRAADVPKASAAALALAAAHQP